MSGQLQRLIVRVACAPCSFLCCHGGCRHLAPIATGCACAGGGDRSPIRVGLFQQSLICLRVRSSVQVLCEACFGEETEDTWAFHPLVGVLRDVWRQCAPNSVDSTPGPAASPTALALPSPTSPGQLGVGDPSACVGHRLTVSQRDKMRRDLESKYTGLYVTESTLPSMPFLQTIQTQAN